MQAILLAGGLGTRLRSVVSDRPKPMALIGEKPFMEYVVHELSRHGITDIIFAVGYKGSMVEEYFGDGSGFAAPDGTPITVYYAYEEELLGTAGAIKNAGRFVTEDSFFVLNADTFYQIDYSLTGFNEKTAQAKPGTINGGVYLMKRALLDEIPAGKVSLENEMIPKWLSEGRPLGGFVNDGYFIDIGIPEAYYQFIEDVERGVVVW